MSSWEFNKNIRRMKKWNKLFLSITCLWAFMILASPLMLEPNKTGDLSGSVGIYDNEEVIEEMNPIIKLVYYLGDVNCHQLSHRSYEYNNNQMPFCARDVVRYRYRSAAR